MKTKQQLKKEHSKWTVKYMEAHRRIGDLLPSLGTPVQMSELLNTWPELVKAQKEMSIAWDKMLKIQEALSKVTQD
jgi:hypothetical protein